MERKKKKEEGSLVSVRYYAKLCGVTPKTISERIKEGRLGFIEKKIQGRKYRYINIRRYPALSDQRKASKHIPSVL